MNVKATSILNLVGYAIAVLITCAGIAALTGLLLPSYVALNARIFLGIIMILYGVFRAATTYMKQRQAERWGKREDDDDSE